VSAPTFDACVLEHSQAPDHTTARPPRVRHVHLWLDRATMRVLRVDEWPAVILDHGRFYRCPRVIFGKVRPFVGTHTQIQIADYVVTDRAPVDGERVLDLHIYDSEGGSHGR
jgi:hypothetical protein